MIEISPQNLAHATRLGVSPDIHPQDFIFDFHKSRSPNDADAAVLHYLQVGKYCANLINTEIIAELKRVQDRIGRKSRPTAMLDFASGYGCVARHLPKTFPDMKIITCDIHEEAVRFCSENLEIPSIQSSTNPADVKLGQIDMIIALSFFSHMPQKSFGTWLRVLAEALPRDGALLFTTRGHTSHAIAPAGIELNPQGFGFLPGSEQKDLDKSEYGLTVSLAPYVVAAIATCENLRLICFRQGLFWGHQDAYLCVKD